MSTLPEIVRELEGEIAAVDKTVPELRASIPILDRLAREVSAELREHVSTELRDGGLAERYARALAEAERGGIPEAERPLAAASSLLADLTALAGQLVRQRAKKAEGDARFLEGHRDATRRHVERLRPLLPPPAAPADETPAPAPAPVEEQGKPDAAEAIIAAELAKPLHPDGFGGSDFPPQDPPPPP